MAAVMVDVLWMKVGGQGLAGGDCSFNGMCAWLALKPRNGLRNDWECSNDLPPSGSAAPPSPPRRWACSGPGLPPHPTSIPPPPLGAGYEPHSVLPQGICTFSQYATDAVPDALSNMRILASSAGFMVS